MTEQLAGREGKKRGSPVRIGKVFSSFRRRTGPISGIGGWGFCFWRESMQGKRGGVGNKRG